MINNIINLVDYIPENIISSTGRKFRLKHKTKNSNLHLQYSVPQPRQRGFRTYSFIIPQFIILDRLTVQVIGLFVGELYRSYTGKVRQHNVQLSFANSEPNNINYVLDWFECLGIPRDKWKWRIQFNKKFRFLDTHKQNEARKLAAKEFWIKQTRISEKMSYPTMFNYVGSKKGNMRPDSPPWGTLIIDFGNNILFNVITTLIEKLSQKIETSNNQKLAAWYLSGIVAGEADVTPSTHRVCIGAKESETKNNIKRCLKTIEVIPGKDSDTRVRIFNVKNMWSLYKFNVMNLHPKKYKDFLYLLLSIKHFLKDAKKIKGEIKNSKPYIKREFEKISDFIKHRLRYFNELVKYYFNGLKNDYEKTASNSSTEIERTQITKI